MSYQFNIDEYLGLSVGPDAESVTISKESYLYIRKQLSTLSSSLERVEGERDRALELINGLSTITNEMKAECNGEFKWVQDWPYYDEHGTLHESDITHTVPWDLVKTIYKAMLAVKLKHPTPGDGHAS